MLAHPAECIKHAFTKEVDIGVTCGMGYSTQVSLGSGDRLGIGHAMYIWTRTLTGMIFARCESLGRVI